MKNIIYSLSFLFLFITSPTVFAVPPYLGVSVAENLAFEQQTCLSTAKRILKKDGFQKIVQFRGSMTIFAAAQNKKRYSYKALVKCLSESGVIFVVAVAQVPKHALRKAERLRKIIQKQVGATKRIQSQSVDDISATKRIQNQSVDDEYNTRFSDNEDFEKGRKNNIVEEWQSTLLSRMDCLSQAEMSLRNSGFYRKITLLDDSIFGKNANNYQGLIKCIHSNSQVYFQVKGKNAHTLEQLLDKLQLNF